MSRRPLILLLVFLLALGCTMQKVQKGSGPKADSDSKSTPHKPWDGEVRVDGAIHKLMVDGETGAMVGLGKLLPNGRLYAVGALAELAGEVTVLAGKTYLSYPDGAWDTRSEMVTQTSAGAALLVSAEVGSWQNVTIGETLSFAELDGEIARLAAQAGIPAGTRFPFLLEGHFRDMQWHVIDGTKRKGGGTTPEDHFAGSIRASIPSAEATLVGFYSEADQGIFTHRGLNTHMHCVFTSPPSTGHVDHVVVPAGTVLKLPR